MANHSTTELDLIRIYEQIAADTMAKRHLTDQDLARTLGLLVDADGNPYPGQGLSLQILLDQPGGDGIAAAVQELQDLLTAEFDDVPIYCHPRSSLHLTVFPFTNSVFGGKTELSAAELAWVRDVVSTQPSFTIRFRRFALTKGDIFLEGVPDTDAIAEIRRQLSAEFPDVTPTVLVHLSVARVLAPLKESSYARLKHLVRARTQAEVGRLEVLEMSLTRHFDSVCTTGEYHRIALAWGSQPGTFGHALRLRTRPIPRRHTAVVVCRPQHLDALATLLRRVSGSHVTTAHQPRSGTFALDDDLVADRANLIVGALRDDIDGTVCAAANALLVLQEAEKQLPGCAASASIVLAGGRSTRNLVLAPNACKALIQMPGGKTLIQLTLENLKNIISDDFRGTLIAPCDEVHLLTERPEFSGNRFGIVTSRLQIDDPYLPTCGCCRLGSDDTIDAFYEKIPRTKIAELFPDEHSISVSFGPYYLPTALRHAFIDALLPEHVGEFSRMIEASLTDEQGWLASNPGYSHSFWHAARKFHRASGCYSSIPVDGNRLCVHIGSNREFRDFCMRLFDSAVVRGVLTAWPNSSRTFVDTRATVAPAVELGDRVIITGDSRIANGYIGDGCVLIDVHAAKIGAGPGAVAAHTSEHDLMIRAGNMHGTVRTKTDEALVVTFPLATDIKSEDVLHRMAISL